jgi:hypothetical protein
MKTYNIIYDKGVDLSSLLTSLENENCQINEVLHGLRVINLQSESNTFSDIDGILLVEEDFSVVANPETDDYWHLRRISKMELPLPDKHKFVTPAVGEIVYLVDSGINLECTELSGSVSNSGIENLYSFDGNFDDTDGHGTALASLIVGNHVGVSPGVLLKSVKIPFGQEIPLLELLKAFNVILEDHLITSDKVKVVNCSWTIPKSFTLDTKISELQAAGLVVVAAAGNQLDEADKYSPVGLNTVLGVGASDIFDRVIAWGQGVGSNWGPEVDLFAPGIDVSVSNLQGNLIEISGTSVAASIVSAITAQVINLNPNASAFEIQELITNHTTNDILFRNEEIYNTTPNKLLTAPSLDTKSWSPNFGSIISVKKGDVIRIPISILLMTDYSIGYDDILQANGKIIKKWDWASIEKVDNQYELVIDSSELEAGKYVIHLFATLENENSYIGKYTVGCYLNEESELMDVTEEIYLVADNEDTITVVTKACSSPADCPKGTYCYITWLSETGQCNF